MLRKFQLTSDYLFSHGSKRDRPPLMDPNANIYIQYDETRSVTGVTGVRRSLSALTVSAHTTRSRGRRLFWCGPDWTSSLTPQGCFILLGINRLFAVVLRFDWFISLSQISNSNGLIYVKFNNWIDTYIH